STCGVPVIYTHVNNTNPVLIEDSPQRAAVERAGLTVGHDGMCVTVSAPRSERRDEPITGWRTPAAHGGAR
ncbi:MAG TPA: hypothetical protein VFY16_08560, partial [Gemmatimonadaceae bacterium]|nr:hypothetical protein [Gemmatimonadaceae bacterium]